MPIRVFAAALFRVARVWWLARRPCTYADAHGRSCVECPRCKMHMTPKRALRGCAFTDTQARCPMEAD